jgi:hypothetical protein
LNKIQEHKLQVFENKILRKIFGPAEEVSNLEHYIRSYSVIYTLLGYGLNDRGSISGRGWELFFHHCVPTSSGVQPDSYPMGTRGYFPGGKAAGE